MHIFIRGDYIKYRTSILFLVVILSITIFLLTYIKDYKIKKEYITYNLKYIRSNPYQSISYFQMKYNNPQIIGKIKINNTSIDSLIVKHSDNRYYLSHNLDNNKSKLGSIFLDYRNSIYDKKLIIYGHNFKRIDGMFKDLEKYDNKNFLESNKKIELNINDSVNYYNIFSVFIITKDSKEYEFLNLVFDQDEDYLNHLNYLKNKSIFKSNILLNKDDEILVLQTCYYKVKNSFIVVVSRKEK